MQRYYPIPFDITSSTSAIDRTKEVAYRAMLANYTAHISYHLKKLPSGKYLLVPNHRVRPDRPTVEPPAERPLTDGTWTFVIQLDKSGYPKLKMFPSASHHFLAERESEVLAAGEIHVVNGEIVKIDGEAGGYHYLLNKLNDENKMKKYLNKEEQQKYKASIERVIKEVGLPFDRYQFSDEEKVQRMVDVLTLNPPTPRKSITMRSPRPLIAPPVHNPPVPAKKKLEHCRLFCHVVVPTTIAFAIGGAAYLYSTYTGMGNNN